MQERWKSTHCFNSWADWILANFVWPQQLSLHLPFSSSTHPPTHWRALYLFLKGSPGECSCGSEEMVLQQYFSNPCTEQIINAGRAWMIIGKINAWCRGLILQWQRKERKKTALLGIPNTASNSQELALGLFHSLNRQFSCKLLTLTVIYIA